MYAIGKCSSLQRYQCSLREKKKKNQNIKRVPAQTPSLIERQLLLKTFKDFVFFVSTIDAISYTHRPSVSRWRCVVFLGNWREIPRSFWRPSLKIRHFQVRILLMACGRQFHIQGISCWRRRGHDRIELRGRCCKLLENME